MMQWAALHAQELGPLSQLDIVTQAERLTKYASAAAAAAVVALLSVQGCIPPLLSPCTRVHNQSMAHMYVLMSCLGTSTLNVRLQSI